MKKLWLVILILLLVGCNKNVTKELVCNQKLGEFNFLLSMKFNDNVINDINFECTTDVSKYSKQQIEAIREKDFCSTIKNNMNGFEDSFIDCHHEIKDKELIISSKLDINKITKKSIRRVSNIDEGNKALVKEGYTCIIK